jgi:hypothetical protein
MVPSPHDLPAPVVSILYCKPSGKDAAEGIYLFDQEAAKMGFRYHAEYSATSSRWYVFTITVSHSDRSAAQRIVEQLNPPHTAKRERFFGWWVHVEPMRLAKTHRGHPWIFAVYRESAYQRDDGLNYTTFLFRDKKWKVFGVREWLGNEVAVRNDFLEKMAHRVVADESFRRSLVSDDPDLPLMWKKR